MIGSHPGVQGRSADALLHCIENCLDCAQACTSCADACLGESQVANLAQCIRLNMDCAELCGVTAAIASRMTGTNMSVVHQLMSTCAEACRACKEECWKHAEMHEHCRICAGVCEQCEESCLNALPLLR
jgi:hypothetical protein